MTTHPYTIALQRGAKVRRFGAALSGGEEVSAVGLSALGSAVSGGLIGLIVGAIMHHPGKGAAWGAGIGAAVGLVGGGLVVMATNSSNATTS